MSLGRAMTILMSSLSNPSESDFNLAAASPARRRPRRSARIVKDGREERINSVRKALDAVSHFATTNVASSANPCLDSLLRAFREQNKVSIPNDRETHRERRRRLRRWNGNQRARWVLCYLLSKQRGRMLDYICRACKRKCAAPSVENVRKEGRTVADPDVQKKEADEPEVLEALVEFISTLCRQRQQQQRSTSMDSDSTREISAGNRKRVAYVEDMSEDGIEKKTEGLERLRSVRSHALASATGDDLSSAASSRESSIQILPYARSIATAKSESPSTIRLRDVAPVLFSALCDLISGSSSNKPTPFDLYTAHTALRLSLFVDVSPSAIRRLLTLVARLRGWLSSPSLSRREGKRADYSRALLHRGLSDIFDALRDVETLAKEEEVARERERQIRRVLERDGLLTDSSRDVKDTVLANGLGNRADAVVTSRKFFAKEWPSIVRLLLFSSPRNVCENKTRAITATARRTRAIIACVERLGTDGFSRTSLRELCVHLGSLSVDRPDAVLSAVDRRLLSKDAKPDPKGTRGTVLLRLLMTASRGIASRDALELTASIAQFIIGALLLPDTNSGGITSDSDDVRASAIDATALLETLMGWIGADSHENEDSATTAVSVHVLACFVTTSDELLSRLFSLLRSKSTATRRNALRVIDELCRRSASPDDDRRDMREQLASALIDRLDDDALQLRSHASRVLATQDPAFVVPRLCRHMAENDANLRLRSAAANAFGRLLAHPESKPDEALTALLDTMRHGWRGSLRGGDGEGFSENDTAWHKHALGAVESWAATIASSGDRECRFASDILSLVVLKALSAPSDATAFSLLRALQSLFPLDTSRAAVRAVLARMRSQIRPNDIVVDETRKEESMRALLFARLSPVLILKSFPAYVFSRAANALSECESGGLETEMWTLLADRATSAFEFDEVRKQAAEVLGRFDFDMLFPRVAERVSACATKISSSSSDTIESTRAVRASRAFAFAFCNCAVSRSDELDASRAALWRSRVVPVFDALLSVLLASVAPKAPNVAQDELHKLQRGCIDAIASAIFVDTLAAERGGFATSSFSSSSRPRIVELRDEATATARSVVSEALAIVSGRTRGCNSPRDLAAASVIARVCVGNALLTAHKILTSSQASSEEKERFARALVSVETSFAMSEDRSKSDDDTIWAVALRMRFVACYHSATVAKLRVRRLFPEALRAIRSCRGGASSVRVEGLKLLGAIMGSVHGLFRSDTLPIGSFGQAIEALKSVANLDPDATTRALAEKLLRVASSGVGT